MPLAALTPDNWIAISSGVVALIALGVAWHYSKRAETIAEKQNGLAADLNKLQIDSNRTAASLNGLQLQANTIAQQLNALTSNANENSQRLNELTEGQVATELRVLISDTAARMLEASNQIVQLTKGKSAAELTPDKRSTLEGLEKIYRGHIEQNLNAYEEACSRYRDGRINQDRFRKTFWSEVRQLCEADPSGTIRAVLQMPPVSRFKNIWWAYERWHNPENNV